MSANTERLKLWAEYKEATPARDRTLRWPGVATEELQAALREVKNRDMLIDSLVAEEEVKIPEVKIMPAEIKVAPLTAAAEAYEAKARKWTKAPKAKQTDRKEAKALYVKFLSIHETKDDSKILATLPFVQVDTSPEVLRQVIAAYSMLPDRQIARIRNYLTDHRYLISDEKELRQRLLDTHEMMAGMMYKVNFQIGYWIKNISGPEERKVFEPGMNTQMFLKAKTITSLEDLRKLIDSINIHTIIDKWMTQRPNTRVVYDGIHSIQIKTYAFDHKAQGVKKSTDTPTKAISSHVLKHYPFPMKFNLTFWRCMALHLDNCERAKVKAGVFLETAAHMFTTFYKLAPDASYPGILAHEYTNVEQAFSISINIWNTDYGGRSQERKGGSYTDTIDLIRLSPEHLGLINSDDTISEPPEMKCRLCFWWSLAKHFCDKQDPDTTISEAKKTEGKKPRKQKEKLDSHMDKPAEQGKKLFERYYTGKKVSNEYPGVRLDELTQIEEKLGLPINVYKLGAGETLLPLRMSKRYAKGTDQPIARLLLEDKQAGDKTDDR